MPSIAPSLASAPLPSFFEDEILDCRTPLLVDFYATWWAPAASVCCVACRLKLVAAPADGDSVGCAASACYVQTVSMKGSVRVLEGCYMVASLTGGTCFGACLCARGPGCWSDTAQMPCHPSVWMLAEAQLACVQVWAMPAHVWSALGACSSPGCTA